MKNKSRILRIINNFFFVSQWKRKTRAFFGLFRFSAQLRQIFSLEISGSLVAFPAHPPRLKAAAPFMHFLGQRQQQQHGYGMGGKKGKKRNNRWRWKKMRMERREKRVRRGIRNRSVSSFATWLETDEPRIDEPSAVEWAIRLKK